MLKKVNRLAKDRDIQKTIARGRSFFSPNIGVKFLPSAETLRFTVVVSTKVFKKAVDRNRVKRILREYIRKNLEKFAKGSYLVSVKPKAAKLLEKDLLQDFISLTLKLRK